jgi:hypothetical protein
MLFNLQGWLQGTRETRMLTNSPLLAQDMVCTHHELTCSRLQGVLLNWLNSGRIEIIKSMAITHKKTP